MEVSLLENGNQGKEEMLACKSHAVSDTLRNTNMMVQDDSNQENEACEHFSIREYVAQAGKQDPHSCSPFETDNLSMDLPSPVPQKKFRRWDCSGCVSKVVGTDRLGNSELILSSDQSANINTSGCVISFLGTSPVPPSVGEDAGPSRSLPSSMNESNSKKDMTCVTTQGCHLLSILHAATPDTSDNEPLSTFIKLDKRRVMPELEKTKTHTELEKSKEIHELMATTSRNSDLSESPVLSKLSKVHGKKTKKVRSIAEIIGNDKLVPPQNECTPDDSMVQDHKMVKGNWANEVAGKSGLIKTKLKKKYKSVEVSVPSVKECTPVDFMNEHLTPTPMKENQPSEAEWKSGLIKAKRKKSYKTVKVVVRPQKACAPVNCMDEDIIPINEYKASQIASRSRSIQVKSKTKYKALEVVDEIFSRKLRLKKGKKTASHDKCAKVKNLEGQNVTHPSSWGLSSENPSIGRNDKNELLIGAVVRRKRTKMPRKFVHAAGVTGDEIASTKSCRKQLQLVGNKEANFKQDQSKIISQKRKIGSSIPERGTHSIQRKKQKVPENISNDIPMDIVEILANSLREKHLTDETASNSNSNTNSNLRESSNYMPPTRTFLNSSNKKSAFNRTSEIGAFKYGLHTIHSTHNGNINLNTVRLDPSYGYIQQSINGSVIQQAGNGRRLDLGCTLLQLNASPVPQTELYQNEVIPATHLLQLMNSSTSCSPSLNIRSFARSYNPLQIPNHYQNLNQSPCKLFRPQPRLGVFGSQLQKEITRPANNCGTQSGYRIGNGPIAAEGICTVNRNPADFTVIDENNEYMIEGREIKPITGVYYRNLDGTAYLPRGIGDNRAFPASGFLHTSIVN